MGSPQPNDIAALDLTGTEYTVEQTGQDENLRPEYEATDAAGDTLFRCTYNMYQGKDEFSFVDATGEEMFTVKAIDTWDIAGDYLLTDSRTDEEVVVLDNDVSLFQDTWRIRDPADESLLAEMNSRGALYTIARKLLPVGQWIGHEFEITDAAGDSIGTVESDFAINDRYEITLTDTGSVPTESIVAGTVVVDGIQGN